MQSNYNIRSGLLGLAHKSKEVHGNILFSLVALFFVVTIIVGAESSNASALTYQHNIPIQFTFNPSISINLSSADLIISNLSPGSSSDSNIISVTVSTNAAYGYNLSATVGSKGGTTALTNPNTSATFTNLATTASTLSNIPENYWGYSYSVDDGTNWISGNVDSPVSGYAGLPLDNNDNTEEKGKGGITLQNISDLSGASPIKFKIGAKASSSQPSGEYTNVINFYAVANPEPQLEPISCSGANKICYGVNSLGPTEGTMGEQSQDDNENDLTGNSTVTLLASNFSREGYGFAGWNTEPDYSGTFYGPQETITTPADMSAGLPLYAIWIPSAGSMQTDAASVCSNLNTAPTNGTANLTSVSALTDSRDNETYAIAKLADGQCWMIENLRLEAEYTRSSEHQALAQGYGTSATYGNFSGLANAENANFSNSTTANSLYYSDTQSGTASVNIGTTDFPDRRMPRYNNHNHQTTSANRPQNPTANDATNSTTSAGMYSYGNYYTWAAAIADTTYYNTNNQSVTNTSLCPKGWHLPQGGDKTRIVSDDDNDFWNLIVDYLNGGTLPANYGSSITPYYYGSTEGRPISNKLRSYPNNFLYSGFFGGSSALDRGSYGYYWSSTTDDVGSSYYLNLYRPRVYPGTDLNDKYSGFSIRCVAGSLQSRTHTVSYEGTTIPGAQLDFYVNGSYYDSIISPTESRHTSGTLPLDHGDVLQLIFDGYDVYVDNQMVSSGDEFVIQGDMEITFE